MTGAMADGLGASLDTQTSTREFGSWMASEQKRIFLLCRRMLEDVEEADSATQDAFLKAWQALNRPELKELEDAGRWLTRIAVNTCLDRLRSRRWQFWRKRPNQQDEQAILELAPTAGPNAEDHVFATEISRRLESALQTLSLRQRAAFTLRHYEDRSLAEF